MRTIRIGLAAAALCGVALPTGRVDAAVTAAPGYAVRSIPTPGKVQGGVVRQGADIFVGQGPTFTGGAQSVIRFTEGGPVDHHRERLQLAGRLRHRGGRHAVRHRQRARGERGDVG